MSNCCLPSLGTVEPAATQELICKQESKRRLRLKSSSPLAPAIYKLVDNDNGVGRGSFPGLERRRSRQHASSTHADLALSQG